MSQLDDDIDNYLIHNPDDCNEPYCRECDPTLEEKLKIKKKKKKSKEKEK